MKKNRQHNGQKKKYKRTNNDLQNMIQRCLLTNNFVVLVLIIICQWNLWELNLLGTNVCIQNIINIYTNLYEEEQTTQWPKEKVQKDKQWSTKHAYKTKDRVTRTPLKTGGELRCSANVCIQNIINIYTCYLNKDFLQCKVKFIQDSGLFRVQFIQDSSLFKIKLILKKINVTTVVFICKI
jgi:hypothetical protein